MGSPGKGLGTTALGHLWGRQELGRSRLWGRTDCQSRAGAGMRTEPVLTLCGEDEPEGVGARGRVHLRVQEHHGRGKGKRPRQPRWRWGS